MLRRGVCGVELRHQVVVTGFLYAALAIFGFSFGFMLLQDPEYFATKAVARQKEWERQETERLEDERLQTEDGLDQIIDKIKSDQVGRDDSLDPKNKVKIYDPDQESAWQELTEKPGYEEGGDKGLLIKDLNDSNEEDNTSVKEVNESDERNEISDPDPIPEYLKKSDGNKDYDYESLDSVKDKAADTLLNNEESDDLDNDDIDEDDPIDEARIGLESSEKDNEEDDFFEEDVVADGKDSAFGNDDGRLPEDESGPSPKGSEPSLQESDPSPQEIDATLDNKDSSKENEDSAADSDEATTTATSETNSERLHSYYVLINFIQREGVEVMIASLIKFVCSCLLIIGARRGWHWCIVPWIVEEFVEMVAGLLQLIYHAMSSGSISFWGAFLVLWIYLIGGYFIYSVACYHFLLKRMKKQSQEVISSVSQGNNNGGFQVGLNYQRLEEEVCWQAEPNLAMEFKDRESGFVRESRHGGQEENDDYVLYIK